MRPSWRLVPMFALAGIFLSVDAAFATSCKWKAYATAMKSDLRNMESAQQSFRSDYGRYTTNSDSLGWKSSTGVSLAVRLLDDTSWTATATHSQSSGICFIYVGSKPPGASSPNGTQPAEPWCEGIAAPTGPGSYLSPAVLLFLITLTLATFAFLPQRGRRNWPGRGLVAVTLVYLFIDVGGTGFRCAPPPVQPIVIFASIGLLFFALALRRHVRAA